MKYILTAIIGMIILGTSCSTEDKGTPAIVKDTDLTECACCGGWVIILEDSDTRVLTDSLPIKIDIEDLPVEVYMEYVKSGRPCDDRILVTEMSLR